MKLFSVGYVFLLFQAVRWGQCYRGQTSDSDRHSILKDAVLKLAKVFEEMQDEECFERDTLQNYVTFLESAVCRKSPEFLYISATEIYELPSFRLTTSCTVPAHPIPGLDRAVAGLSSGSLIICGGMDARLSSCHTLSGNSWVQTDSLLGPASQAAASQSPGGLMVTGGYSSLHRGSLSTTQFYSDASWSGGPQLPVGVAEHCQVYDGQHVIIIGGETSDGSNSAAVYSLEGGQWTRLPFMTTARADHACVIHQQEVWVIGGWTATVEILNLSNMTWREGPQLTKSMPLGQAIVIEDDLYFINQDGLVFKHDDGWEKVATIGSYSARPVFPAPIVTKKILNC